MRPRTLLTDIGGEDYSSEYLTIVSTSNNNTIGWKRKTRGTSVPDKTISISTDNGSTWVNYTASSEETTLAILNTGDKLLVKGNNSTYSEYDDEKATRDYCYFQSTGNFEVKGNIMSLLYGDNFEGETELTETYTFETLFNQCTGLIDISGLVLPATTLTSYCYRQMFLGCSGLTSLPSSLLPATTLATNCYEWMFSGCTSLTTVPSGLLPATTLADYCYRYMFRGCTGLTTIPSGLLPATTLATYCYNSMFYNCTGLTTVPSDLLPATTLATYCYNNMFSGCTSLTTAPDLPAIRLVTNCYNNMFYGCSSLNYIKCLAMCGLSNNGINSTWLYGVSSTGTFVKHVDGMRVCYNSTYGVPNNWTVQNLYSPYYIDGYDYKVSPPLAYFEMQLYDSNGNPATGLTNITFKHYDNCYVCPSGYNSLTTSPYMSYNPATGVMVYEDNSAGRKDLTYVEIGDFVIVIYIYDNDPC